MNMSRYIQPGFPRSCSLLTQGNDHNINIPIKITDPNAAFRLYESTLLASYSHATVVDNIMKRMAAISVDFQNVALLILPRYEKKLAIIFYYLLP